MAKREVPDFDPVVAFDKALAQQKPDLAARLGATEPLAAPAVVDAESSSPNGGEAEPRLRVVPSRSDIAEKKAKRPGGTPAKATRRRGVVARASGKELRRLTVYVELSVAQRLRKHCFDRELNLSEVAAEALELGLQQMLDG
jgi:hypothetical protein